MRDAGTSLFSESVEYNHRAGHEHNIRLALRAASLHANLPSVRMCNTCGGRIRAKWECWAALRWASAWAASCSSTAASLSCLPDQWTCSRVHTWNFKSERHIFAYRHKQNTKSKKQRPVCTETKFALTLSCAQTNLSTNFFTGSSDQDMECFAKLNLKCCLPQKSYLPLLISSRSKGLQPFEFLLLYSESRQFKIFTTTTANSPCWPEESLPLRLWRGSGIMQSPDQTEYLPPVASAAASEYFARTPLSAVPPPGSNNRKFIR